MSNEWMGRATSTLGRTTDRWVFWWSDGWVCGWGEVGKVSGVQSRNQVRVEGVGERMHV